MHARTGRIQASPDRLEDTVEMLTEEQIPRYREQPGYKGFTVLANRESGELLGVSFWDSADALQAAEELGEESRAQAARAGEAEAEPITERWEVVLDDTA